MHFQQGGAHLLQLSIAYKGGLFRAQEVEEDDPRDIICCRLKESARNRSAFLGAVRSGARTTYLRVHSISASITRNKRAMIKPTKNRFWRLTFSPGLEICVTWQPEVHFFRHCSSVPALGDESPPSTTPEGSQSSPVRVTDTKR